MADDSKPFDGKSFARRLTTGPGVYLMRAADGAVLYVGKAANLRKRVASYFDARPKGSRIMRMIGLIDSIEVALTRTEGEALLLENEWIKSHMPRYNVLLRDDKSYPWLMLTTDHEFPRIAFHRGRRQPRRTYLGPYPSAGSVRESINLIQKTFRVRNCEDSYFSNRSRPCLQYQIKRCTAPCVGKVSPAEYQTQIEDSLLFLRGQSQKVITRLIQRMEQAPGIRLIAEKGGLYFLSTVEELDTPEDFIHYASANQVDIHDLFFELRPYESTESCITCHEDDAIQMLDTGHFKWQGKVENIVGLEGQEHGKNDLLNNFCVAVPTNEARCAQCHVGYGYQDASYDFSNPANVDCLVCHDQSGTYKKNPKTAGMPDASVDLNAVARSISIGSVPRRQNCISCHAGAGGGDNVKHGDISSDLIATTRDYDVHMGVDGANLDCIDCHGANHDPKTGDYNHGIAGMSLHSVNEGEMKQCTDCHGQRDPIHAGTTAEEIFAEGWHDRLACQTCHIPAIARKISTKVEWYWSDAGQDISPIPVDPATGRPTYDKMKGSFVWKNNVRPTLRYASGKWNRVVVGVTDKYESEPISLADPVGSYADPDAMIYPFKLMIGDQPVDPVTKTVLVPHLFGTATGPNPYWGAYDWSGAIDDGTAYTGQDYSGTYGFADTTMLLSVNHEIAPADQALGMGGIGGACMDCHDTGKVDWHGLGWSGDPLDGGLRISAEITQAPATRQPPD